MTINQPKLIPVTRWNEHHDWPSVSALRWLIFNEHRNGFAKVVIRVGSRVLLNEEKFFEWVSEQNQGGTR